MNHKLLLLPAIILSTYFSVSGKIYFGECNNGISQNYITAVSDSQNQKNTKALNETQKISNSDSIQQNDCSAEYSPVTGIDNRYYLNACWASSKGVGVKNEGYDSSNYKRRDIYTWPIERVCIPLYKSTPVIESLNDGTLHYIYQGKEFRGTPNQCKCLPPTAKIACPGGEVDIKDLKKDDLVWTINQFGEKITAPIILINQVAVSGQHRMVYLELKDDRKIEVTPGHPSSDKSSTINEFNVGDAYDGSIIIRKEYMDYEENYTFDILPEGITGCYWANGILIGSTLLFWNNLVNEK